ncbi:MAG TPA: hypothetical protein VET85_11530, partial [Stellaceae bacterium]|nr:hypothetical protein [Stellaceae bacterium]
HELSLEAQVTPMMTSERQIWQAAILLVRRHAEEAIVVAEREAEKHCDIDDLLTHVVWRWIARVTAELVRPEPDEGEHVH